jgi:uncharacterized iron-regulated protein
MANQVNSVLIRIDEELKQFSFVHPLTRNAALGILNESGPEHKAAYLNEKIPLLRRLFGDITHPMFADSCSALAKIEDPASLCQALGESNPDNWWQWIRHADRLQTTPSLALAGVANHLALPIEFPTEMNAMATILGANLLRNFQAFTALWWLERFVGLRREDYERPEVVGKQFDEQLKQRLTQNNAATFTQTLADALSLVNRAADAAMVLERFVGLRREDYERPEVVGKHLDEQLKQRLEQNTAATFTKTLAESLILVNRAADAAMVLERFVGLRREDYERPEAVGKHLDEQLKQRLMQDNAATFTQTLGDALYGVNRAADAAMVLERFVGLRREDYERPEVVGKQLDEQLKQRLTQNNAANFLRTLAESLLGVNRAADAAMVLERFVGLRREDYERPEVVGKQLDEQLKQRLAQNNAANFTQTLAESLLSVNRAADAAMVLERFVGLRREDYERPEVVGKQLDEQLKQRLEQNNAATLTLSLAESLLNVNRAADAAMVLERFVGLRREDYERPEVVGKQLDEQLKQRLEQNNAASLSRTLAESLLSVNRAADAAMVLERFVGLLREDYERPEVVGKQFDEQIKQRLTQDNAATFTQTLANALSLVNRDDDAWMILDLGTEGFSFLDSNEISMTVQNVANLVLTALRLRPTGVEEDAEIVDLYISWSRRQLDRHDISTTNRIQLLKNIRVLRSAIIELADRVSLKMHGQGDLASSKKWRERGLRWDAGLGQRVLLERILEPQPIPNGSEAVGLWEGPIWPMYEELRPSWSQTHRPKIYEELISTNCALEAVEPIQMNAANMNTVQTVQVPPEVAARWRKAIDAEPSPETLAAILGEDALLIRSNFVAPTDQICWTAFLSRGGELKLIDHDQGTGSANARVQIEQALIDHECRIAFAYLPDEKRKAIEKLIQRTDFQLFCDHTAIVEVLARKLNNFAIQVVTKAGSAVGMAVAKALSKQMRVAIASETTDRFQEHWSILQQIWLDALSNSNCTNAINAATAQLIKEVQRVWNLDSLAEHLSSELDVVVMADEILGSIPVSLLRCGDRELFRQVRSVRSTLSLMLDQFAAMAEAEAETAPKAPLAAVSYFAEGDGARIGAADLHHGLMHLAEQHGYALALAADQPLGTVEHVHRACANDQGLSVLVTYGHGSVEQSCVVLGPDGRPFQGRGCRLSQVEFPQLISCSVGQNRSSGAHDFEGLSCELARAGARAALVAVWPIHSLQAAHFSNEVTHQYLKLRKQYPVQGSELTGQRLRALAVNLARREVLKEQDDQGKPKYLNTVAAFSLLGLA